MIDDNFDIATLYKVATDTRNKIQDYGVYYGMGEWERSEIRVRAQLIDPILRALGWDPANRQKVILEYDTIPGSSGESQLPQAYTSDFKQGMRYVDYALCLEAAKLSPSAIVEVKTIQNSTDLLKDKANQLFCYGYNINYNPLQYKEDLLYKVISDGNTWLIYSGEERDPINQLICELKFSNMNMSIDTIIVNLSMLSFPAIKHKAEKKLYGDSVITVPISKHIHKEGLNPKYVSITIDEKKWKNETGKTTLENETGKATDLWREVLIRLFKNHQWKTKIIADLPIKKSDEKNAKLILADCNTKISSMNRKSEEGRGNKDKYVLKVNSTEIVFEATSGTKEILKYIQIVLEKCGIDINKVFLKIDMGG